MHLVIYSHQVFACVGFAYPVKTKIRKKKSPWLKSKKKTGPKKKMKVFDEGWRKTLAETDKGSWFNKSSLLESDQLPSTSSASEGARWLKLEGLSINLCPKTKRLQMIQCGLLLIEKISSKGMHYVDSAEGYVSAFKKSLNALK